nr:hypothetical protein [Chthoniobacterales bacterium]
MRLRLGIQGKLVITLVLAGLLPLLLSLVVLLVAIFRLRVTSVGQSFQAFARQDADNLGTLLSAQVELAHVFSQLPGTTELLLSANTTPASTPDEIARIEADWAGLPETDPQLREILHNRIADQWHSVRENRMRFAEVMVTDATGRLIAATNKTSDYFQADEDWWQQTREISPRVRLEDARWDSSAQSPTGSSGLLVVNVCIPLTSAADKSFLGAMKVSLDAAWLADHLQTLSRPSYIDATIVLVSGTGARLGAARPTTVPDTGEANRSIFISPAVLPRLKSQRSGWITRKSFGDDVLGFARVDLPEDRVGVDH